MTSLHSPETTVTNALVRLLSNLEKEQVVLDDMLARAPALSDGRKVFRDAQGNTRTLVGETIDKDLAATIQWRGDEPSYEDIIQQKTHVDNLKEGINEVCGIETELGGISGELTNNEEPPTLERVGELKERIGELQSKAIETVIKATKDKIDADVSASIQNDDSVATVIPKMPKQ